jgi:hypothetical protein
VKFSVIVPVRNKCSLAEVAIPSILRAAARSSAEVIVIDNGSTDGILEILQSLEGCRLLRHDGSTVGAVRNFGVRHAGGDHLVFIDSDIVVPEAHLETAAEVLRETSADAVGSEYGLPDAPGWIERTWHRLNVPGTDGYREYVNGGNLIVRREAFEAVKGFNETLEAAEDTDLCRRLVQAGFRIYESQRLAVVHLGNPKDLRAFFRQQIWHGLGVPSTQGRLIPNKPMTMAGVHVVLLATAGLMLGLEVPGSMPLRLALAAIAALGVPMAAYGYRTRQTGRWTNPIHALVLFEVYFVARGVAMLNLLVAR